MEGELAGWNQCEMSRHVPKKFMPRFANAANRPASKSRWTLVCRVICIKRVRKIKSGKAYILSSKLIMEKIGFTSSTVRSAPSLVVSLIFPVPTSTKYSFILLEEFIQLIFLKLGPWLAVWSKLLLTASRASFALPCYRDLPGSTKWRVGDWMDRRAQATLRSPSGTQSQD